MTAPSELSNGAGIFVELLLELGHPEGRVQEVAHCMSTGRACEAWANGTSCAKRPTFEATAHLIKCVTCVDADVNNNRVLVPGQAQESKGEQASATPANGWRVISLS